MKRVITHGMTRYTANCNKCNCAFEYDLSDINDDNTVSCPDCGHFVTHFADNYIYSSMIKGNDKEKN